MRGIIWGMWRSICGRVRQYLVPSTKCCGVEGSLAAPWGDGRVRCSLDGFDGLKNEEKLPCAADEAGEMQGVLRLRICFASRSKFLAQDDSLREWVKCASRREFEDSPAFQRRVCGIGRNAVPLGTAEDCGAIPAVPTARVPSAALTRR